MRPAPFTAIFVALEASDQNPSWRHDDRRLWTIAFVLSPLVAAFLIIFFGAFFTLLPILLKMEPRTSSENRQSDPAQPASRNTLRITSDMIERIFESSPALAPPPEKVQPPEAVRTSEDQRGKRPDRPPFIGERNTQATSDQTPDPSAKPMPSQRGVQPRDASDIETTESVYQDGSLEHDRKASAGSQATQPAPDLPPPPVSDPAMAPKEAATATTPAQEKPADPAAEVTDDKPNPAIPEPEKLLQGPNPFDINVPKPAPEKIAKTLPPGPLVEKETQASPQEKPPATPPKPRTPGSEPGFRGNQRKTAIQGSISRTGRSALDVADSPLGRYQAALSRAVEKEWQRNCVRHRDFITPGFLTVRFFVEPSGKVKSVQFVGEMTTSEIQKGFTLNSIRDAEIPAMPKELRADYASESLELIFNFYF